MPDVLVLCYHAVSPTWNSDLAVMPEEFERQIKYLTHQGWQFLTFTEAALFPPVRRTLAITFDDAFASVKEYAAPILARHGVPATLFAPTDYMTGGRQLSWPGIEHWRHPS